MKTKMTILGVMLLLIVVAMSPVSAGGYAPIQQFSGNGVGTLQIGVLCHHNLFSKEMIIERVTDVNTIPFVNGNRVDVHNYDLYEKVPGTAKTIYLNMGGNFDDLIVPGIYGIKLIDGNGGQPEYAIAQVFDGGKTTVMFIGHAVSLRGAQEFCVPGALTIDSASYGATDCAQIIDVAEHTEYRYWISGVPAHTEYSFRDWIPAGMMEVCYPEVNHTEYSFRDYVVDVPEHNETVVDVPAHTEYRISTYQVTTPGYTEHLGSYNLVRRGSSDNYDAIFVGSNTGDYNIVYVGHDNGDYNRDGSSSNYKYVGHNNGYYDVKYVSIVHPAVYGWVVTTSYTDGTCPLKTACAPKAGDTQCVERNVDTTYKEITVPATYKWTDWSAYSKTPVDAVPGQREVQTKVVVDTPAYCEMVQDPNSPAHWGEWSAFSDTPVEAIPEQREVQTRWVPDDMTNGQYSEWSDTPQGYCAQTSVATVAPVNEPCQTRIVPATYKNDPNCAVIDVTSIVQGVVDGGTTTFMFSDGTILDANEKVVASFTDPAPNAVKGGTIEFSNGCSTGSVKFVEGDPITIGFLQTLKK